jgi:hypothetical protein
MVRHGENWTKAKCLISSIQRSQDVVAVPIFFTTYHCHLVLTKIWTSIHGYPQLHIKYALAELGREHSSLPVGRNDGIWQSRSIAIASFRCQPGRIEITNVPIMSEGLNRRS